MRELQQAQADRERQSILTEYGVPVAENLKACQLYGIGEPMATQLSELKHVTPELIAAHVKSLVQGETKGLAIVRIRNDEMPRLWIDELIDEHGRAPTMGEWSSQKEARKQGLSVEQWQEAYGDPTDE
jgi:hypothetical protein